MVKPGITGLWQVNGRSDLSWDESVRLDLRYVENWSFVLDLQILWKTLSAVTSGSGAYLIRDAGRPAPRHNRILGGPSGAVRLLSAPAFWISPAFVP